MKFMDYLKEVNEKGGTFLAFVGGELMPVTYVIGEALPICYEAIEGMKITSYLQKEYGLLLNAECSVKTGPYPKEMDGYLKCFERHMEQVHLRAVSDMDLPVDDKVGYVPQTATVVTIDGVSASLGRSFFNIAMGNCNEREYICLFGL